MQNTSQSVSFNPMGIEMSIPPMSDQDPKEWVLRRTDRPVIKFVNQTYSIVGLTPGLADCQLMAYAGLHFKGKNAKETFFKYTCPCGVEVSYPLNGIPEVTTPHPCGVDGHYSVLFED